MKEKKGKQYLVRQVARSRDRDPARELVRKHPAIEVIEPGGLTEAAIVRMTESTARQIMRRHAHLRVQEYASSS